MTAAIVLAAVGCLPAAHRPSVTPAVGVAEPVCWRRSTPLTNGRTYPCATVLRDGRLLVIGGDGAKNSAEVFDPATATWTLIASPTSVRARCSAVLLPDGRALVTGGQGGTYPEGLWAISAAEIYDPATNSWTPIAAMNAGRFDHQSILLPSGNVLVLGSLGQAPDSTAVASEWYDFGSDRWTGLPFPASGAAVRDPQAVLTRTGEVVLESSNLPNAFVLGADLEWHIAGLLPGHFGSGLIQLPSGHLMIPGALNGTTSAVGNESAEEWREGPSFDFVVRGATTIQLASGDVLVVGGHYDNEAGVEVLLANALLFDASDEEWRSAGRLSFPGDQYRLLVLDPYRVLAMPGGNQVDGAKNAVDVLDVRDLASGCADAGHN